MTTNIINYVASFDAMPSIFSPASWGTNYIISAGSSDSKVHVSKSILEDRNTISL
jgi:hypothetical protein